MLTNNPLFINEWHDAGRTVLHDVAEEFVEDEEALGNETKVTLLPNDPYPYQMWVRFAI